MSQTLKRSLLMLAVFFAASTAGTAQEIYNVMKFGARGDGVTDDAASIQSAVDACSRAGGGMVLLPASHTFLSGPFSLKSNVNFHVEGGTILLANPDEKIYTQSAFRKNLGEGTMWIGGEHISNVTISGTGEINGNGILFMGKELEDSYELKPFDTRDPRPHVLTIIDGKNIRIHDIHIGNSAYWTIHLAGCTDVVISGVSVLSSLKVRNSDGIDVDHSKNVRISDCYIESGDDCICLKNRREYEEFGACENITVSNCTMTSRSCAIKIGSENMDAIRRVLFTNCVINKSNRGIGIQNRDEGVVQDVVFSNMIIEGHLWSDVWWGKAEPIYVTAYRRASVNDKDASWRLPSGATEGKVGEVKNIYFNNIKCTSENGIFVGGESADKIKLIFFEGVDIVIDKTTHLTGGRYDRRPAQVEPFVSGSTSAFYIDGGTGISIRNCSVKWGGNKPDYFAYVLESRNTESLSTVNLIGDSAFPDRIEAILKK